MIFEITPALLSSLYWITITAVAVSSASGVLRAGCRKFDLFGVLIIGITTGLGGGTIRDLVLGIEVFWFADQWFFIISSLSSILVFVIARYFRISSQSFLIPDAMGLAIFSVIGTISGLMVGAPWLIASFMGVVTGVMGGVIRDMMCDVTPIAFKNQLNAVLAWAGSFVLILILESGVEPVIAIIGTGVSIFVSRLLAIRYDICLPSFKFKDA
ncbi:MAG TPA: trimeric intracellular cation channel family protein [Gammaproteobacteria bacterium]|nr:trimeric intracellular cation channel family protein [Gammaproteobacteria bacterium]